MISDEQKEQFSDILEELGKTLDISESQYEAAVKSFTFVGGWLSSQDSPLSKYNPEILPQGSFLLQTMIKPIHEEDELDIDLVCKIETNNSGLTQHILKHKVGDRLKDNGILVKLLKNPDGKRCWTLQYAESAKFHLDILPAVVSQGYKEYLNKAYSGVENDYNTLSVRITDKTSPLYKTSTNLNEWMKTNPFGYAIWFQETSKITTTEVKSFSNAILPVPKYKKNKTPLQRVVQILKRHRDMMFNGDDDKPISIIITTLAALSYNKQNNIIDALINVVNDMPKHIKEKYCEKNKKEIKWISNPVNDQENFADRWIEFPERQQKFYDWMDAVKKDINNMINQRGIHLISESIYSPFGKEAVINAMNNYGEKYLKERESGSMRMAGITGTLGNIGRTNVKQHKPFGNNE